MGRKKNTQIIAMGGGGFSMEPRNLLLDRYILAQAGKKRPKVCFLPTASGDAQNYIDKFYRYMEKHLCIPNHLSLFRQSIKDIEQFILSQDVIYVGGGNTVNMLFLWKKWGVDKVLKKAWEQGVVLAGLSAGSICWFEEGLTDSSASGLDKMKCLGFLKGSNCPHYNSEKNRRPVYQQLVAAKKIKKGIAADDGVGLHYVDGKLFKVVSSVKNTRAYVLKYAMGEFVEVEIVPNYLK